ncbi:MAG TPA: hypothetical protein VGM44_18495 [Polyangiaceae bacterium]
MLSESKVVLLAALLLGCSGSASAAGTCSAVGACGGDVTGTWAISNVCFPPSDVTEPESCGNVVVHASLDSASGTIAFDSDGTETQTVNIAITESTTYPTGCISTQAQCDTAKADLAVQPNATDVNCSFSGGACSCSAKVTTSDNASSSYQISGTSLTIQTTGAPSETDPYCVMGNQLTLQTTDPDGNVTTITATK